MAESKEGSPAPQPPKAPPTPPSFGVGALKCMRSPPIFWQCVGGGGGGVVPLSWGGRGVGVPLPWGGGYPLLWGLPFLRGGSPVAMRVVTFYYGGGGVTLYYGVCPLLWGGGHCFFWGCPPFHVGVSLSYWGAPIAMGPPPLFGGVPRPPYREDTPIPTDFPPPHPIWVPPL